MRVLQRVGSSGKSGLRFQNPNLRFAIYYEIQKTHFKQKNRPKISFLSATFGKSGIAFEKLFSRIALNKSL